MENPRVLIIGAGVNGSAVASGLFTGGVDVTVLARGRRLAELQAEGVVIENPFNHQRTITRVPVCDHLAPDDIYDFVLVIVRKNQALDLLPLLSQNQSPCFVFMGNNLVGPAEFINLLGRERVMMGAVYAAGKRDGSLIRAMVFKSAESPFGELDGSITPRLKRLAAILNQGGFKVKLSSNIIDTQMTHGVGVAIIAMLVVKHDGKIRQLARSTDDLTLFVAARREGQQLIHHLGHQVIPRSEVLLVKFPTLVQVLAMRLLLNSKFGEVGLEYHVSQAPDEMRQMAMELRQLVSQAGIPLPAIQKALAGEV